MNEVAESCPISINSLTKRYGNTVAVDGLTFDALPGRVTAFVGPNGAGKSTTLRVLLGLIDPTAGRATVGGRSFCELQDVPRTVGAVMEDATFHPGRTGRSHLRVLATMARVPARRIDDVLEIVDLKGAADRRVGQYSLGMRRRLALAAALLGNPQVLILDEPSNGLDPPGIRWLREFLRREADRGGTVLVSSHVLSEISQLADDVVMINEGRLVRSAPLAELLGPAGQAYRLKSPDATRLAELLRANGIQVRAAVDDELIVDHDSVDAAVKLSADAGLVLREMRPDDNTLEDVFLALLTPGSQGDTR